MKIGTGRYSNLLARFLTGTADLEVVPELSAEISPVFTLENDRPEWLFLANQRLMGCRGAVTAGAALAGTVRVRNPLASNVLAVIDSITICGLSGTQDITVRLGTASADLASALTVSPRDSRWTGTLTGGALKFSQEAVSPAGDAFEQIQLAAGANYRVNGCPIILAPGSSIDVSNSTVLVATYVNFNYRERAIGKYERA